MILFCNINKKSQAGKRGQPYIDIYALRDWKWNILSQPRYVYILRIIDRIIMANDMELL
jgi:hypothetical protein